MLSYERWMSATGQETLDGASGSAWKISLALFVIVDLFARLFVDIVGLGDSIALPVSLLLTSKYVFDWATLGWVFGWILYASVVFQMAPLLLPRERYEWAHGLPNRLTMAIGAVGIGVFIEREVLQFFNVGSTPLPLSANDFPLVIIGIIALLAIALLLPPIRIDSSFLYTFERTTYPIREPPSTYLIGPYLLVVGILGVLLAHVSLLFPIPELLILGLLGLSFGRTVISDASAIPARREHAERIVQGASAIWQGPRGLVWVGYIAMTMFVALALDAAYLIMLDPFRLLGVRPLDALFVLYCLTVMTVVVMISSTRLAERIPARLHERDSDTLPEHVRERAKELQELSDEALREKISEIQPDNADDEFIEKKIEEIRSVGRSTVSRKTPPGTDKERVPGFLLHAGIPVMVLELARSDYVSNPPVSEIPALELSPLFVGVALTAGSAGLVSIARPSIWPTFDLSDYKYTIYSFAGLSTTTLGIGFYSVANSLYSSNAFAEVPTAIQFGGNVLHVVILCLVPYLGFELFVASGGLGEAVVTFIAASIVMSVGSALSSVSAVLAIPGFLLTIVGIEGTLIALSGVGMHVLGLLYT